MMSSRTVFSAVENVLAPNNGISHREGTTPPRIIQGPLREDWDRHRAAIKRMYFDEDRSLKDVMSVMANEYNLRASTKMFKYRIRKWGLDKKNKEHEMVAVLRKKKERDDMGKLTSFRIRGKPIDIEEVFRYCRKKGRDYNPPSPVATTPSDISCWTPAPSRPSSPDKVKYISSHSCHTQPGFQFMRDLEITAFKNQLEMIRHQLPLDEAAPVELWDPFLFSQPSPTIRRSLPPPQALLVAEKLFANIYLYFQRCLGDRTWILGEHGQLISGRIDISLQNNPGDIIAQCSNATSLFKKGSFVEGRRAISQIFALIQNFLYDELPTTLECFLASLLYLTKSGLDDIASMLRRYIGQMAVRVLPYHHPWCQVCCMIGLLDADEFQLLLGQSYSCVVDAFERELGRFQGRAIACRVEYLHSLHTPNDVPGAERHLRKLLSECEDFCGPADWRSQYIMVSLGWALNHQGKYAEAEAVGEYALQSAPNSDDSTTVIRRLELIGDSQYRQGKAGIAEANIRDAIDQIGRASGRADPWAIENMIRLERWLLEWGRDDEAVQLKVKILDLLGPDDLISE